MQTLQINNRPRYSTQKKGRLSMTFYIKKTSGEKETFSLRKLRASLRQVGADDKLIDTIVHEIERLHPKSTKAIHAIAFSLLQKQEPHIAARYNLRRALMELGPAGFSFEQFIARTLTHLGYSTTTNVVVPGACVEHEVDIIAEKDNQQTIVECKFHHRLGLKIDVKVTLYVQARFEDIQRKKRCDHVWLFTNTKFTSEAIAYANCMNMKLTGWSYPTDNSLARLIDRFGLHPITALTSLSNREKKELIRAGLILCRDAGQQKDLLKSIGLSGYAIKKLIREAHAVCKIEN